MVAAGEVRKLVLPPETVVTVRTLKDGRVEVVIRQPEKR